MPRTVIPREAHCWNVLPEVLSGLLSVLLLLLILLVPRGLAPLQVPSTSYSVPRYRVPHTSQRPSHFRPPLRRNSSLRASLWIPEYDPQLPNYVRIQKGCLLAAKYFEGTSILYFHNPERPVGDTTVFVPRHGARTVWAVPTWCLHGARRKKAHIKGTSTHSFASFSPIQDVLASRCPPSCAAGSACDHGLRACRWRHAPSHFRGPDPDEHAERPPRCVVQRRYRLRSCRLFRHSPHAPCRR
eukprot:21522-Rhodomonas_salina.1